VCAARVAEDGDVLYCGPQGSATGVALATNTTRTMSFVIRNIARLGPNFAAKAGCGGHRLVGTEIRRSDALNGGAQQIPPDGVQNRHSGELR
jgi:hypothetical protein